MYNADMKNKIIASGLALLFAVAPALAFADTPSTQQLQLQSLLISVANLEAQLSAAQSGQPIACALLTSKTAVQVGEPFTLAWGSIGAENPGDDPSRSVFEPNSSEVVSLSEIGTFKYSFTFYAANGATATCSTTVIISPAMTQ